MNDRVSNMHKGLTRTPSGILVPPKQGISRCLLDRKIVTGGGGPPIDPNALPQAWTAVSTRGWTVGKSSFRGIDPLNINGSGTAGDFGTGGYITSDADGSNLRALAFVTNGFNLVTIYFGDEDDTATAPANVAHFDSITFDHPSQSPIVFNFSGAATNTATGGGYTYRYFQRTITNAYTLFGSNNDAVTFDIAGA